MKIYGLITVLSLSVTPACTLQPINVSLKTTNLSALALPISTYCNASAFWLPENTSADDMYYDCYAATLEFYGVASGLSRVIFEFHAAGVRQWPTFHSVITPVKYIYSTDLI